MKLSTLPTKQILGMSLSVALLAAFGAATPGLAQHGNGDDQPIHYKNIRPSAKLADVAPKVQWFDATKKPSVILLCIHGLGLHKGNYEAFGKEMSKYGIGVVAIDMRGFGTWLDNGIHPQIDFDGSLADIQLQLQKLHKDYPGIPVVVVGESMGGAIALRTTALYPELVQGLVSCVPSGDRFNEFGQNFRVGMHVLFGGGFNKPMNIGDTIVKQATNKDELRKDWSRDPDGKMNLTPHELMQFAKFMRENDEAAKTITNAPVLFIQGAGDKLVRPAGTWQLYDNLATPNRQLVFSAKGEHLILEESQFSPEDLLFIRTWINKNITPLDPSAIASVKPLPTVATSLPESGTASSTTTTTTTTTGTVGNGAGTTVTNTTNNSTQTDSTTSGANGGSTRTTQQLSVNKTGTGFSVVPNGSNPNETLATTTAPKNTIAGLNYWIELLRDGKTFRCNNKTQFKSGDSIRFHVIPESDGFAYLFMNASSTGKRAVLYPTLETGSANFLHQGKDYALPSKDWLTFDNHPGVEKLSLVFSKDKIAVNPNAGTQYIASAFVGGSSGSKDLVPTRMQLSWDDPTPVIIPDDFSGTSQVGSAGSLVRLKSQGMGVLSVDVALEHR